MLANYFKIALKVLGRRKFFTFISLFGISLTLVVLMIVTAVLDNLFAPRAPETRFDRALVIYTIGIYGSQGGITGNPGYGFLDKYVRKLAAAEKTTFFTDTERTILYHRGRKIETRVRATDGAYWQILDFKFLEGSPYTQEDDDNANHVAVISRKMRDQLFGRSNATGQMFEMDGQRFRVTGVVDDISIFRTAGFGDIWIPNMTQKGASWKQQMNGQYNAVILARSTADFPKLRREFDERLTHFVFEDPKNFNRVVAGLDTPFEAFARSMHFSNEMTAVQAAKIVRLIFLILGLLFISLPTMNLVSINLSRILERASEIGVRKAFGASSRALVSQFVLENVLLTVIGGFIGFILSVLALHAISSADLLPNAVFDINLRIFFYGMLLAAVFGVISGVYPAWRMSRLQPVLALRGGAQ
ncbi:MAG TPA: ABC transporter permease [Thermoanaerobaculia bacterium]|nr:ABC transporter permease [Thermoanaerobaculia bacterium]